MPNRGHGRDDAAGLNRARSGQRPMSTPASKRPNGPRSLLRLLQKEGKLAAGNLERIEHEADEQGLSVTEILEREGVISEKELAVLLATTLRLRIIDLTS